MPNESFPKVDRTASSVSVQQFGRIGYLNDGQRSALDQLKRRIDDSEWKDQSASGAGYDDVTLVRFLRARKFDVTAAWDQFNATQQWRHKIQVDKLYDEFPVDEFVDSQEVYTQFTGRRAKSGQPLYVYKIGGLTKERVNRYSADPSRLEPRMIALTEMMTAFTLPLCDALERPKMDTPIDSTICIVDVSGVSMTRFWQLKGHMQRASVMATAHYPETLGAIFLVGAPSFFSVVWSWVNRWFDQVTVSKIFILGANEVFPTLSRHIDPSNIPKRYGGQLDWDFGAHVQLDDDMKCLMGVDDIPRGPVRWSKAKGVEMVGSGRAPDERVRWTEEHKLRERLDPEEGRKGVSVKDETKAKEEEEEEEEDKPEVEGQAQARAVTAVAAAPEDNNNGTAFATPAPNGSASIAVVSSTQGDGQANGSTEPAEPGTHHHTIQDAMKDNPAAPVKDLAAKLEGTAI